MKRIKKRHIVILILLIVFSFPIRASWLIDFDSEAPIELFMMEWDYNSDTHTYQNYVVVDDPDEKAELKQILERWCVRHSTPLRVIVSSIVKGSGSGSSSSGIRCGNKILAVYDDCIVLSPRYGIPIMYGAYGTDEEFMEQVNDFRYRMMDIHETISEPKQWNFEW